MIDMSPELVTILMFAGIFIGLATGHPIAFILGGLAVIFGWLGMGTAGWYLFMGRTFDTATNNILIAIPLFILMANFLEKSGIADGLFEAMMYLFGPIRGGVALAVVFISVIFAACTGIVGVSVVSMSLLAIPIMMRYRYSKQMATGVVAAGGTLGILIPPSIMLVMMADQSGISVGRLFAGAFLPGFTLGCLYAAYVAILCLVKPSAGPSLPKEDRDKVPVSKRISMALVNLVPPMILIFGVLGSIWTGVATPTEASGVGAFMAFVLVIAYRKFTWKGLADSVWSAARTSCMVMTIMVGATAFTAVFLGLGGGNVLTDVIMGFGFLGKWGIFGCMMGILFILGCLIDWVAIVLITLPIFVPIAQQLGFDKLWFVEIIAINLQMSFLTPPFGYALFYLKGTVPPSITMWDIYKGIVPFVLLQAIGLAICCIYPELITYLPTFVAK